jgi:dephospho-CoA kinase
MIIGVTGGLATGTSSAAKYIAVFLNADIICADKIAHRELRLNKPFMKGLVSYFGSDIMGKRGYIDRKSLAKKAFLNKSAYKKLCNASYPVIKKDIDNRIKKIIKKNEKVIVIDAPMLIESGFYKKCDMIIVVTSSLPLQVQRCEKKNISAKDALSRIGFQTPLYKKVKYADYVIDNSGELTDLRLRCKKISEKIKRSFGNSVTSG